MDFRQALLTYVEVLDRETLYHRVYCLFRNPLRAWK